MRIEAWASRETGHGGRSKRAGFDHSSGWGREPAGVPAHGTWPRPVSSHLALHHANAALACTGTQHLDDEDRPHDGQY